MDWEETHVSPDANTKNDVMQAKNTSSDVYYSCYLGMSHEILAPEYHAFLVQPVNML
jgi:hypothetical protein